MESSHYLFKFNAVWT